MSLHDVKKPNNAVPTSDNPDGINICQPKPALYLTIANTEIKTKNAKKNKLNNPPA